MISIFGGFSGMGLRLGAEYDLLADSDVESNIISARVNYGVRENLDVFVRFDTYDPDAKYTYDKDIYDEEVHEDKLSSNYIIAGIIFNCGNGLSVAPNVRMRSYEDEKNSTIDYNVNFEFKF